MKICVAQTKSVKGDIATNIIHHKKLIGLAVAADADMIFFPELSITGYEPELAKELATDKDDIQFDEFQDLSDDKNITIGIGMPVVAKAGTSTEKQETGNSKNEANQTGSGIMIGMIIFQPGRARQVYCKQYLHADENPYFIQGDNQVYLSADEDKLGLSICYEISVPEHSENVHRNGATIYISSVAKTAEGMKKAAEILPAMARNYSMTVLLANCVGHCDNFDSVGMSSVWNNKGLLLGQLDDRNEGILVLDTVTGELVDQLIN
jgi:predicted amidohydrolase